MPTEVKVPAMGESISSGIIAAWHVASGDYVEKDQVIYELETDKITSEAIAESAGVISLKAEEGDEVEIGQVVAEIDESAARPDTKAESEVPAKSEEHQEPTDKPKEAEKTPSKQEAKASPEKEKADTPGADLPPSPAVRRLAEESGIAPDSLAPGSGKGGRVTKGDMLAARDAGQGGKDTETSDTAEAESRSGRTSRRKISPIRKKIAQRLVAATQEAALLTTFNEVDMSAVIAARKQYQEDFVQRHGVKLGFMSFFVKATVEALKAVPQLNVQIDGDYFIDNHYYDIGVAVGTDKGLVVPVVRDCDEKDFAGIEQSIIEYARRARDGKITLDDMSGGVFTISNGGIYGSMLSTPLLNMPQSGILGLHNITERAVVIDGQVVARPMMYLALSYDHRVVDGKEAVTFLIKIKQCIENPQRMLLNI